MDSEFKQFLDTLKRLGISFSINWAPTKAKWQKSIIAAGYSITALACTVVTVADTDYIFSNGAVSWTTDEQPVGPAGLLLFSHKKSGEIIPRILYGADGRPKCEQNLPAIKEQYRDEWFSPQRERSA